MFCSRFILASFVVSSVLVKTPYQVQSPHAFRHGPPHAVSSRDSQASFETFGTVWSIDINFPYPSCAIHCQVLGDGSISTFCASSSPPAAMAVFFSPLLRLNHFMVTCGWWVPTLWIIRPSRRQRNIFFFWSDPVCALPACCYILLGGYDGTFWALRGGSVHVFPHCGRNQIPVAPWLRSFPPSPCSQKPDVVLLCYNLADTCSDFESAC